ncbi:UDP-glucose 4-epimerase GalE [Aureibacter tunicatorum]|uniref:UDP-glucose 4-epimerase n=1 Tax=Aureibacter tunicatorum TaxID=866807 RepID=A0AAE3XQE0_9BACT|nr:UDP-glucose 4-epimerase GalE [Aureibacter tunicatorum]MDR6240135.1 UDP-glucose 4-epimerase [Aureibacter tunicatorum]BDD05984.1 UDP-glucose 4-epimerase [Aureibacter tunicatorum]
MDKKGKILVTGGAGYIGSHTAVELINQGFEVVIIDNLSNSHADVIDRIEQITGTKPAFEKFDICEEDKLEEFFIKHQEIQAIIHFAASKAVGESVEKPLLYYKNNIISLINLMKGMKKHNIPNIVFSSSCTVYGEPDELPVTEKAPVKPAVSPYGNTKQIDEEILKDTAKSDNFYQTIALRYFNPIGAHESALIGELPLGVPANLVPFITQTAAGIREQLSVFGDDYNTPDGTCIRDYIHVVDLAKAHIVAVKRLMEGKNKSSFEFFNLGTGKGTSVLEAINSFEKVSGVKLNYKIVARREGDIEKVYADTSFANEELGWKSEKELDEMMLSAWKWQQKITK